MKKHTQIAIVVFIALAITGLALFIFLPKDDVPAKTEEERLESEHHAAISLLNQADGKFFSSISFDTKEGTDGNVYTIGVLTPELESFLGELVDAYNADPSTKLKLTEEELRRMLTEDITKTATWDYKKPALEEFIYWTDAPADLVNKKTEEEVVLGETITNYDFIKKQAEFSNYFIYNPNPKAG